MHRVLSTVSYKVLRSSHHLREMLLPTSTHSNKLIWGGPTDARRLEPYTEEGNVQKNGNQTEPAGDRKNRHKQCIQR